ncbi:cell wall anchor protein [Limosilactobacillus sp. Sa3CUN2]|uniref:Cell wall anchor protein n=1 Tax=Limosilactobacillus avistercoris TaxID=2762243 RepID=A0ABR8PER4_9LACO|nr:amidase family protein [Limosilactobacillus avistercoris]MBD7895678.1 cell wall anchor protein [Limosilactobacillus avistercoris]
MKSHHYYSRFIRLIATGVLLIGNLSLATPVLADSSIENQVTNKNGQTTSQTMSGNSQVATDQANTTQSEEIHTTNRQLREPAQQVNKQVSQEITEQPAGKIAQDVKNGTINNQQLIDHVYQKIDQSNQQLNNVIYVDPVNAQKQLEKLKNEEKTEKLFYGVPILIKGLGQAYKGYPNTEGLPYLKNNTYHYTNNFVKKLQKMGFIIVGSTNFPELGLINITNSNLNGVTHNPWDLTRNPGGSSGGATASVAAGIVPIATGNDAGGSLRIPASWSGVIGLKPTQGLITGDSMTPSVVNFADTRSIDDTVSLLKGLMDNKHAQKLLKPLPRDLKKVKIAYSLTSPVGTPVSQDAKNAVLNAVNFLRRQGFNVVEQNSPVDGVKMMQAYYLGALDDGSVANFLAQQKLHRSLTAADVTNGLVSPMTYALYEASKKAPKNVMQIFNDELKLVHEQMTAFHNQYPVYLTPTTATVAPLNSDPAYLPEYVTKMLKIKDLSFEQQMQLIYDSWLHGLSKTPFTQLANLAGEPALSLPIYVSAAGLPLGIQLEGAQGSDFLLLELGKLFEAQHQLIFLNEYRSHEVKQTKSAQLAVIKDHNEMANGIRNIRVINQDEATVINKNNQSRNNNKELLNQKDQKELPLTGSDRELPLLTIGLVFVVMLGCLGTIKLNKQK